MLLVSSCKTLSVKTEQSLQTASGYQLSVWQYQGQQPNKETAIIYLHGKNASPASTHNAKFIQNMVKQGYDVYALIMPWSPMQRFSGSLQDGWDSIAQVVNSLSGRNVVIAGHSMGGMAVLQYGTKNPPANVIGLVSIAPGHDPNTNQPLRNHTAEDAHKACATMQSGEGDSVGSYSEMKSGNTYRINATAEYYCTHYSVEHYPNSLQIGSDISRPVLLISGLSDSLTRYYFHDDIFDSLSAGLRHQHETLKGTHGSVLYQHNELIAEWIEAL